MQVPAHQPSVLAVALSWGTLALLSSCNGDGPRPGPTTSEGTGAPAVAPAPGSTDASRAGIPDALPRFLAREGWSIEAPTSGLRLHQFQLPGAEGAGPAELVVASFPGGIGPREENLRRWANQMGLAEVDPARRAESTVRHFAVTTVNFAGEYKSDGGQVLGSGSELLASWIEVPGETQVWTVKATGPAATIQRWKDSYMAFIAGL